MTTTRLVAKAEDFERAFLARVRRQQQITALRRGVAFVLLLGGVAWAVWG